MTKVVYHKIEFQIKYNLPSDKMSISIAYTDKINNCKLQKHNWKERHYSDKKQQQKQHKKALKCSV